MMEVFLSYCTIFAEGAVIGRFVSHHAVTGQIDHHTSLLQEKVIVHFDEAYGWRESFLIVLSNHIAQLFFSSPGDIISTKRNWKWRFLACARDLCHHSGDLHRAGRLFFWGSAWHLFNAPWIFICHFDHLPVVRFAVTCVADLSACHPPTAYVCCMVPSYQMWLLSSSCMFWLLA